MGELSDSAEMVIASAVQLFAWAVQLYVFSIILAYLVDTVPDWSGAWDDLDWETYVALVGIIILAAMNESVKIYKYVQRLTRTRSKEGFWSESAQQDPRLPDYTTSEWVTTLIFDVLSILVQVASPHPPTPLSGSGCGEMARIELDGGNQP